MAVKLHKLLPHGIRRGLHHILCRVGIPCYCEYVSNYRLKKRQEAFAKSLAPRMEHQNLSSIAIDPSTNANCLFLTMLPLEIRLQIYTEVFGDAKFSNYITVITRSHLVTIPLCCCQYGDMAPLNYHLYLLSLPKTCRQIYVESLPYLYTLQTFRLPSLSTVVSFSRSLLPTRLSLIRHLQLNLELCHPTVLFHDALTNLSLDETWDIIATQMTGLRELEVWIFMHSHVADYRDGTEESEKGVLSGLAKCRGLRTFEVRVEHLGRHPESGGVDEGVRVRRWREELARTVTRPRVGVGEIEDVSYA